MFSIFSQNFQLLLDLSTSTEAFREIMRLLISQMDGVDLGADWAYFPAEKERSPLGYVGLQNQGATCYMNSLLQQLYLIPDFR
jgi:ubiquitin carboxyl-terminal hydrolase 34